MCETSNIRIVSEAEAGFKLLRFLERGLGLPRPLLFRLLRQGQIRVNKGRAKPDKILGAGDEVRLPPGLTFGPPSPPVQASQAAPAGLSEQSNCQSNPATQAVAAAAQNPGTLPGSGGKALTGPDFEPCLGPGLELDLGPGLSLLQSGVHWLALSKAPGLPVQPGSGHSDCVSARLRAACGGALFSPAPAHRLDKQSSGLLLAGRTQLGLRWLNALFSAQKADLRRIYLVWVSGAWPKTFPGAQAAPKNAKGLLLRDWLLQRPGPDGLERSYCLPEAQAGGQAKEALAVYRCLKHLPQSPCGEASLLEVLLLSGRKHQIRAQCAGRGYPVIGDRRYGGPVFRQMLLHAAALDLPAEAEFFGSAQPGVELRLAPNWPEPFAYSPLWE